MPNSQVVARDSPDSDQDFARRCHVGAIALRFAAERLELLSRSPERIGTVDAGLAIDAMSCAAQSCRLLVPMLLDADIERRTKL